MSTPTAPYKSIEYDYTSLPPANQSPAISKSLDDWAAMLDSVLAFLHVRAFGPSNAPAQLSPDAGTLTLLVRLTDATPWPPSTPNASFQVCQRWQIRADIRAVLGPLAADFAAQAASAADIAVAVQRAVLLNWALPDGTGQQQEIMGPPWFGALSRPAPWRYGRASWRSCVLPMTYRLQYWIPALGTPAA